MLISRGNRLTAEYAPQTKHLYKKPNERVSVRPSVSRMLQPSLKKLYDDDDNDDEDDDDDNDDDNNDNNDNNEDDDEK